MSNDDQHDRRKRIFRIVGLLTIAAALLGILQLYLLMTDAG